ncbi:MAG: nitrilase-related carbon-nitrogen hydrolase, partial [Shimia sp.]
IHMFDVEVGEGENYRESGGYAPGKAAVLTEIAGATLGLTICYDLRFPHLFRRLAQAGAQIITVPSAFTVPTGQAHWETLLRARAIETGAFILAPAQTGTHASRGRQRRTYGHSLAVAPWGEVLADAGTEPGVTFVELDLARVEHARNRIPSLLHDRDFTGPV